MKSSILVIEDDKSLLSNLSTLLSEEGYNVLTSMSGEEGIKLAKKMKPDLIVCDIMMTGISGFEVKKELNEYIETFDIPLIFLTARAELSDLRKGMNLGADDYMFKPYKAKELLDVIHLRIKRKYRSNTKNEQFRDETKILNKESDSISVNIGTEIRIIKFDSIMAILASNQYSNIVKNNGKSILLRKSLNDWLKILPENNFQRIHRSSIVNLNFIKRIDKQKNGSAKVYLTSYNSYLIMSRRYSSKFKDFN